MATIRFIHSADLHLGSPFIGMRGLGKEEWKFLQDSTLSAFDNLIRHALDSRPDFVLIVGDVYDAEDRNLRAQARFQQGMEQLAEAGIQVFLSHGNHDHLGGGGAAFKLPGNVHVFGEQVENIRFDIKGQAVNIAGFSYGQRHIRHSVIDDYPEAEPGMIQIGMLHGSEEGDTEHAVYAPFRKEQLLSKKYDYWALGHIHKRQLLSDEPPIVYPGNLQGRHRKEKGPKGFYEVSLSDGTAELEFITADAVRFDQVTVDCSQLEQMNEVLAACENQLAEYPAPALVAELELIGLTEKASAMLMAIPEAELVEAVSEAVAGVGRFLHILTVRPAYDFGLQELSPFGRQLTDRLNGWQLEKWGEAIDELYAHPKSARFLPVLDESLQEELRQGAELKIRKMMALEDRR